MRYLPHAPLDAATGMPPLLITDASSNPGAINYHHPWFPKRHPELLHDHPYVDEIKPEEHSLQELGGMAVRMSRGQLMPIDVHTEFHRQYGGPLLPNTNFDKFVTAVRGCAGVVPRWGLDVTAPARRQRVAIDIEHMTTQGALRLVRPEYHHYWHHKAERRAILGEYFVRYALLQDFTGASVRVVDEFLHSPDANRRLVLGNLLITQALDASVQPIMPSYAYQRQHKMVRAGAPAPLAAVKKHLVPHQLLKYHGYLKDRLLAA